jgi:hypothetical protein
MLGQAVDDFRVSLCRTGGADVAEQRPQPLVLTIELCRPIAERLRIEGPRREAGENLVDGSGGDVRLGTAHFADFGVHDYTLVGRGKGNWEAVRVLELVVVC